MNRRRLKIDEPDIKIKTFNQDDLKLLLGSVLAKKYYLTGVLSNIQVAEFQIFSQWGDDGIIQYLINYLNIEEKIFIEFGVEDYREANTRFLLMNNNWTGLVMDASEENINTLKRNDYYWKFDLVAKSAFINAENINLLISEEGFTGQIGLLHIDVDGNDYWIMKALQVVQPIILVVEYNSILGVNRAITIPYEKDFNRTMSHYSNLYAGSSLLALWDLGKEKGYSFIGSNSAGNNAYFVKNEYLKDLLPLSAEEGYVQSKFRESRDPKGNLNFLRGKERLKAIKGLPVFNTRTNKIEDL